MGSPGAWALIVVGIAMLALGAAALAITLRSLESAGLLVAIGLVALALGLRARKPVRIVEAEAARLEAKVTPMPLPGAETLARLPEPFSACPRCGYLGVRPASWQDGVFAGGGQLLGRVECERCSYSGIPATFDKHEDYLDFLDELNRGVPRA